MHLPPPPLLPKGARLDETPRPRSFAFHATLLLVARCDKLVAYSRNFPTLGPWEGQNEADVLQLASHEIITVVNTCRQLKQPIPFVENKDAPPRGAVVKRLGFL